MSIKHHATRSLFALAAGMALVAGVQGYAANNQEPVKIEKPQAWKGINQVVIGQFSVAFFTKKVDYDGGGFLSASDKGKAIGHLSGLTNEQFQAMTDAAYADFLRQLAANGITVADDAAFKAGKYFAKVKNEDQANKVDVVLKKQDHADALAFWPTQLGRNNNVLLNLRLMDGNLANTYTAEYDYAKSGGVPVLNVVYYVDFAKPAKSEGGGVFQSVNVTAGLAISPFGTQLALMGTDGKMTKMLLKTPIEEGGDFANIRETTSGLQKASNVAGALGVFGGGLLGGGKATMSTRFDYNVTNPAIFAEKTQSASVKANDLFIRQMAGLR
jgi:hypothetical protein